jgi:hypothetical protein
MIEMFVHGYRIVAIIFRVGNIENPNSGVLRIQRIQRPSAMNRMCIRADEMCMSRNRRSQHDNSSNKMLFGLYSVAAAAGFAVAFEGGRVLERRLLGVQKLGSIEFHQDSWSRRNTYVVVVFLITLSILEVFFLPSSMHPFSPRSDDETFSKRSVVLSSWSGILALGYGGIMAWMRALRNERKLFHLAKIEYERNRQQQEADLENQKVEITKHLKRAAAAGAAAVAQRQQYEMALKELNEQKEALEIRYSERSTLYINPSASLAENERAWSEQLYQAMDMEAFSVAEKAMEKRWKELNDWGVQIEEMRNRNKEQEQNLRNFRETREERIKNEFDHFEGERERLVRLAQELEALKMDIEEYKEETRAKEQERFEELNAKEEELHKRDLDLKLKEEGALATFYEPITLLVSPPLSLDENGHEIETAQSTSEESMNSEADQQSQEKKTGAAREVPLENDVDQESPTKQSDEVVEKNTQQLDDLLGEPSFRVGDILRLATQALNGQHPISKDHGSDSQVVDYAQEKLDETEPMEKNSATASEHGLAPATEEDDFSVENKSQQDTGAAKDELHSIQEEADEAKEIISHDEDDEANEITSMADHEDIKHDKVESNKYAAVKTALEDDCVDDLVEIFKAGSDKSLSITQHTDILDDPVHTIRSKDSLQDALPGVVKPQTEESSPPCVPSMDDSSPSDEDTDTRRESRTITELGVMKKQAVQRGTEGIQESIVVEACEESERTEANLSVKADMEASAHSGTGQPQATKSSDVDGSQKQTEDEDNRTLDLVPFVGDVAETIFKSALASLFSQLPGQDEPAKDAEKPKDGEEMASNTEAQKCSEQVVAKEEAATTVDNEKPVPDEVSDIAAPDGAPDPISRSVTKSNGNDEALFPEYDEEADPVIVTKATGDSYLIDCRSQEELKQILSDKPPLFNSSTDEDGLDDTDASTGSDREEDRDDESEDDHTQFEDARHDLGSSSSHTSRSSDVSFQDAKAEVTSSQRRGDKTSSLIMDTEEEEEIPPSLFDRTSFSAESEEMEVSTPSVCKRAKLPVDSEELKETETDASAASTRKYADHTSLLVDSEEVEVVVHRVESI